MEARDTPTPSMPSASPVVPPSGNFNSANNEGDQRDADRRQSASVATEEAQVPCETDPQVAGQESGFPDRDSTVLPAPTTMIQADATSVPENKPDATLQTGQPKVVEALFMPPELSERHELLRPERQRAMPEIEMIGSLYEETSLNRIINSMTSLCVEGHPLFQQARELDMAAEILARQTAGHYLVNHDRYHELNGGNPPCKGGFSKQVPNFAPGGC